MLYGGAESRRITTTDLHKAKVAGEKWPMITCYDALTAGIFDEAGFPVLLVGDSAAMVVYGHDSTIPITSEELIPLVAAVERGSRRAMVVADLPFGSYQESPAQALATAIDFMKRGNAHAVKVEGGSHIAPHIKAMTDAGIAVFGHIGLTPQSVHGMGGYRVQGRGEQADALLADAQALVEAGVSAIVIEVVPADVATRITESISVPVIGIGAGNGTDAQVIVWQDLLGITPGKPAKFVQQYAQLRSHISDSAKQWAQDVVSGTYPDSEHSYQ